MRRRALLAAALALVVRAPALASTGPQAAPAPAAPEPALASTQQAAPAPAATQAGAASAQPAAAEPGRSGRKYPPRVYTTQRVAGRPPVIDGRLDDEAWSQGEWSGDYTQQIPTEGAKPSRATQLKILYDDRNLYYAIRIFDDPAQVHRYPGRRDDFTGDIVGICVDSYNDKRTGFEFDLTAGGSKIDLILGNGETEWDTSWDPVWDGEVAHDDEGWTAEFRIPLSQIRYGPQPEQVWGLHAWRWIDRNQEEDQWQLIPRQNTGRMHQLGELRGVRDLPRSRHLELLPHVLGRTTSDEAVSSGKSSSGSAGLDVKLGLTSNFTLDATLNPDFGQVEADPSVMNLTAYETFYEEKRPFFLEGRSITSFDLETGGGTLFYSRRIGHAPSYAPPAADGEQLRSPESTTILGAVKVTGKTPGGLSLGVVQSLTQRERATLSSGAGSREEAVEPFGSYTVARVHKDWGKGNTSLGAMLTNTARAIEDPALAFLPSRATTGGVDFARYFGDRAWVLDGRGSFSHVSGEADAIRALQLDPVHYYQRPDASHLGVDPLARSLSGHGGRVRFGRTERGRLRFSEEFSWISPGLELNDLGYLQQADVLHHNASLGWQQTQPAGAFRSYSVSLSREDTWDYARTKTAGMTALEVSANLRNKWTSQGAVRFVDPPLDTRLLRGGPAMKLDRFVCASLGLSTDSSRRFGGSLSGHTHVHQERKSRQLNLFASSWWRPTNLVRLSAMLESSSNRDDLQYVTTVEAAGSPRWLLGRIEQSTWALTLRANVSVTPDLSVQLYASPFVSTGRYDRFKSATSTRAAAYDDRFHAFSPAELALDAGSGGYEVTGNGAAYSFSNPDFSFREFRSNLVLRWEYRPGSALYAVWSQGRTSAAGAWDDSLETNWDALWAAPPTNVLMVKASYWFGR